MPQESTKQARKTTGRMRDTRPHYRQPASNEDEAMEPWFNWSAPLASEEDLDEAYRQDVEAGLR